MTCEFGQLAVVKSVLSDELGGLCDLQSLYVGALSNKNHSAGALASSAEKYADAVTWSGGGPFPNAAAQLAALHQATTAWSTRIKSALGVLAQSPHGLSLVATATSLSCVKIQPWSPSERGLRSGDLWHKVPMVEPHPELNCSTYANRWGGEPRSSIETASLRSLYRTSRSLLIAANVLSRDDHSGVAGFPWSIRGLGGAASKSADQHIGTRTYFDTTENSDITQPLAYIRIPFQASDYTHWDAPADWSTDTIEKKSLEFGIVRSVNPQSPAGMYPRYIDDRIMNNVLGASIMNFPPDKREQQLKDALKDMTSQFNWGNSAVRSGIVKSINELLDAGWLPSPLVITLGHELTHTIRGVSLALTIETAKCAVTYIHDADFRAHVNRHYFGKGADASTEVGPLAAATVLSPKQLSYDNLRSLSKPVLYALCTAAHRVSEVAVTFGMPTLTGNNAPPSYADPVAPELWPVCENSIRDQFGFPRRGSYWGSLSSIWLGMPAWGWLQDRGGCTGGRLSWAPGGLASICKTKVAAPWFQ